MYQLRACSHAGISRVIISGDVTRRQHDYRPGLVNSICSSR